MLNKYNVIIFDFDGVIKESVDIKTKAFLKLFEKNSPDILKKISDHHIENGGVSRYKKIPLYIKWSGLNDNKKIIDQYLNQFSDLVIKNVINSKWVPGIYNFLKENYNKKIISIVSATPIDELNIILKELKIYKMFKYIYGSPVDKKLAVSKILNDIRNYDKKKCILIGDSSTDFEAAKFNSIEFLLRSHKWNVNLSKNIKSLKIKNFLNEKL